ncbi:hypothetical protein LguiB_019465 [Lonicera macranthoides]
MKDDVAVHWLVEWVVVVAEVPVVVAGALAVGIMVMAGFRLHVADSDLYNRCPDPGQLSRTSVQTNPLRPQQVPRRGYGGVAQVGKLLALTGTRPGELPVEPEQVTQQLPLGQPPGSSPPNFIKKTSIESGPPPMEFNLQIEAITVTKPKQQWADLGNINRCHHHQLVGI